MTTPADRESGSVDLKSQVFRPAQAPTQARPPAAEVGRWDSGLLHVLRHEDRDGWLQLYLEAYGARLYATAAFRPDLQAGARYAAAVAHARVALAMALAAGRVPLAGFGAAKGRPRGRAGGRWDPIPEFDDYGFVWPVLDRAGGLPFCVDLLWLDRGEPSRWRAISGQAALLHWSPFGVGLEAAMAGERPLRLYRWPLDWLAACHARQRAWQAAGLSLGPLLPSMDLPEGEDGTIAACVLAWRSEAVRDLFTFGGEAMTVACDDDAHGAAVKRRMGEMFRPPGRPRLVKVAGDDERAAA